MATMTAPPHTDTVVHLTRDFNGDLIWTTDEQHGTPVAMYRLVDGTVTIVDADSDPTTVDMAVNKLVDPSYRAVVCRIDEQRLVRALDETFTTLPA
jgi:hypothetical protein